MATEITADRRTIHEQPELAYEETQTAALVAGRLRQLGIETASGIAGTGVVGLIKGGRPGKTVLLRADMDALPILEQVESGHRSRVDGKMHACGHDGHTAMLLAAARLLQERRDDIAGNVKLMFQPAEEHGTRGGALPMIEAGLLDAPRVDAAFALHVDAAHEAGQIALRSGPTMAAADRFTVMVRGRGGHAARPHQTVDPIVVAAQMITAMQTLVSREVSPVQQAVVTVGSLDAGTAFNVIPDSARLRGTVRTYQPEIRDLIERRLKELTMGMAAAMRASAEVEYVRGYPPIVNHESGVEAVRRVAVEAAGEAQTVEQEMLMGAEDFSYVLQRVPGAMFYLGVRPMGAAEMRPTHSPIFDLDESALPLGTAVLAATALGYLAAG
jgi:amidohydrolase